MYKISKLVFFKQAHILNKILFFAFLIAQFSITQGALSSSYPTYIPNPNFEDGNPMGGFVRSFNVPIVAPGENEDRIWATQVLEDPARNRLLMLAYARDETEPQTTFGRDAFLFQASSPTGPWTRINAKGSPLLSRGASGKWDDGYIHAITADIVGDTMYIAYAGRQVGGSSIGAGLATADLSQPVPTATKITVDSPLELGSAPHQAISVGLWRDNEINEWVLHVWAQRASENHTNIPRRYTNPNFATTGWVVDSRMAEYGTYTSYDTSVMGSIVKTGQNSYLGFLYADGPFTPSDANYAGHIGDNVYNMFHVTYAERGIEINFMGQGMRSNYDNPGSWDETIFAGPTPFYYQGNWYIFYEGNNTTGFPWALGNKIGVAQWYPDEVISQDSIKNFITTIPELTSPSDSFITKDDNFSLSWGTVSGSANYSVEVCGVDPGDTGGDCSNILYSNHTYSGGTNQVDNSEIFPDRTNNHFWWRISSKNSIGEWTPYSLAREVTLDNSPPIITLNGNSEQNITVGSSYTELGATAYDTYYSGDLTSSIVITGVVDTNTIGDYTLSYNVSDAAGNGAIEVQRIVHVISESPVSSADSSTTKPSVLHVSTGANIQETDADDGATDKLSENNPSNAKHDAATTRDINDNANLNTSNGILEKKVFGVSLTFWLIVLLAIVVFILTQIIFKLKLLHMQNIKMSTFLKLFALNSILIIGGYLLVYQLSLKKFDEKYKNQQAGNTKAPVSADISNDYVSLKLDGGDPQAGNINITGNISANDVQGSTLTSTIQDGTAPLSVASNTLVKNLNADMLDGKHADELGSQNVSNTTVNNITNTTGETISPGTTSQYFRGDKTWQALNKAAVGLSNVENATLSTWSGSSNIATLGTVAQGTWNGTAIQDAYLASSANWNTAYNERSQWDGGATGLVAATGRTSLGLGSISTQDTNNVAISGGAITGTTTWNAGAITSSGSIQGGNITGTKLTLTAAGMGQILTANNSTDSAVVTFGFLASQGAYLLLKDSTGNNDVSLRSYDKSYFINGIGVGTAYPTEMLDINSDTVRIRTDKTPASASDTCDKGEIVWDANYTYVCIAINTWKRSALTTW